MADPLSNIANEFAPAPTSYFDKGQAQTLISRYGNASREAASSKQLAEAALQSHQLDRSIADDERRAAKEQREALLMSREDIEYGEKKLADETRSGFLKDFMEKLDPKDEDYNTKLVGFMADLPPSIQKDPTFVDIVKIRSKQADEADEERRRLKELGVKQEYDVEKIDARAKYNKAIGYLTPEQRANVPIDPATGEQDVQWMIHEGTKNMMRAELEMDKAKVDVRKEAAKELKNIDLMDDAQKAVFKETKDIIINNAEAFPSKVAMLQEKYGKNGKPAPESSLKSKYAEEYAAAKDWDSNKFEKEVDVAMDMTLEEYVGKIKDAPPEIQERRKRVWEYANQNKPKEAVTETAPKQTAAPQTAPAAPTVKQVTLPDGRQGILVPVEGGKPRFFLKNPEQ